MTSPEPEPLTVQPSASPLAAALALVQSALPRLGKDETGSVSGTTKDGKQFSYEYKYADLASISRAVLPLLGKHGLAFTSFPTVVERNLVLRYHLLHEDGEQLVGEYPLAGTTAQQIGSSITYARRYCLCAVTGVAPDEDDDAASVEAIAPPDPELEEARSKVRGAWEFQYGALNTKELAAAYRTFADGGDLWQASPGELRKYAAYLSNLPKVDAGGDPAEADKPRQVSLMTGPQRGKLFALMGEIGLHDKGAQLQWINKQLTRDYESRTQITFADAKVLIDGLQKGIDAPPPESEPAE